MPLLGSIRGGAVLPRPESICCDCQRPAMEHRTAELFCPEDWAKEQGPTAGAGGRLTRTLGSMKDAIASANRRFDYADLEQAQERYRLMMVEARKLANGPPVLPQRSLGAQIRLTPEEIAASKERTPGEAWGPETGKVLRITPDGPKWAAPGPYNTSEPPKPQGLPVNVYGQETFETWFDTRRQEFGPVKRGGQEPGPYQPYYGGQIAPAPQAPPKPKEPAIVKVGGRRGYFDSE
jgi:hypothetical protein